MYVCMIYINQTSNFNIREKEKELFFSLGILLISVGWYCTRGIISSQSVFLYKLVIVILLILVKIISSFFVFRSFTTCYSILLFVNNNSLFG